MKEQKEWEKFYSKFTHQEITKEHQEIASFINNIAGDSSTLVDIGCGNGEFSICLSRYFHVTGLDISSMLINKLKSNCIENNRLSFLEKDDIDYSERNDISFLSFCPVIQTVDDIKRIISLTNKYVFILTVDNGSLDYHRFELLKHFPPKRKSGFIKNADFCRKSLEEMKILYKEKKYSSKNEEYMTKENALNYYITYFQALGYSRDETNPFITNYLNNNCVEGLLKETHIMNQTLLYFKIK